MFEYIPKFNDLSDVEYTDYRNDEEREFMTVLNSRFAEWEKFGIGDGDFFMFYDRDILSLGIEIYTFRDLRIDFTGIAVLMGKDETSQYVTRLYEYDPAVIVYERFDHTISQLAEIAADWITYELSRKIELREWITESYHHRQWILADTNEILTVQNLRGLRRSTEALGEPAKVTVVYSGERQNIE